ncbi:MAG TPA: glycosyltransferase family 2 protein [Chitinophagaceae bacterium]|nr:glycosyltransferase family 2 protein [Chitinophagaceae bacterium]
MLNGTEPLVSVITLNYNQAKVTCEFLESCRGLLYRNYEILVCDMASQQDPTPLIASGNYPNTRVLLSKKNLGFAGGNNWGIAQARGDYIFIVNNDTEVTPDLLHKLLAAFSSAPDIGVVCPKIKYWDAKDIIQYAGFNKMNPITGRTSTLGNKEKDLGQYDVSGPTHGAHGCAMMVKREVIDKVGMFPSKFFLYYEEWDWSARIQRAGYTIWYEASAVIYHKESMSVGKNNPMKVYYHTRNRILYMRRNTSFPQLLLFMLFFTFFTAPKAIFKYLVSRQFSQLRYFIKGVAWNLYSSSHSAVK